MELFLGEKAVDIKGYEGQYAITTFGRLWCYPYKGRKGKWFSLNRTTRYIRVALVKDGKRMYFHLHRLVAEAFIPNPENKRQVNHINGARYDCRVSNLEWVTPLENIQHAAEMGLNSHFKLKYNQKREICQLFDSGEYSVKQIAHMYEVNPSCIYKVLKRYQPIFRDDTALAA